MSELSSGRVAGGFPLRSQEFKPRLAWPEAAGTLLFAAMALGTLTLTVAGIGRSGFGSPALVLFLGGLGLALAMLAGWFIARMVDRAPVVRVTAKGVVSNQLVKPVRWSEVEDVELDPQGGRWSLKLRLRPADGLVDRRSFWTGRNAAVPHVELYRLSGVERQKVLELAQEHLARVRRAAGLGESPRVLLQRQAKAFDEQLEKLTPRAWSLAMLVAVNALVWLASVLAGMSPFNARPDQLFAWGGNSASAVVFHGEWWRLATAMFLHANLLHIGVNMAMLWAFGRLLLRLVGHGQFLLVYLASGLCGSAASLHFSAQAAVSVGASGAVFGVLGALFACSRKYRDAVPEASSVKLKSGAAFFIFYTLVQGFGRQGTDNAAHLGGLLCGMVMGWSMVAVFDPQAKVRLREASLAGVLAGLAVWAGIMTTPAPRTWHHELFEGVRIVQTIGPEFSALGARLKEAHGAGAMNDAALARLQADVDASCARIEPGLARIRVPAWEPIGQYVAAARPFCALVKESLSLERRRFAGQVGAAAAARRQLELAAKLTDSMQKLEAFAKAAREKKR